MTRQGACSRETTGVDMLDPPAAGCICGRYYRQIKVDEAAVIPTAALATIDAMGVMASTARRAKVHYVLTMPRKAFVAQDTVAIVALIAQCVGGSAFGCHVGRFVVTHEQRLENGAVGSVRSRTPSRRS